MFAATYPSLLRHYQTFGLYNFAGAHADLPSSLVYDIVRVVFGRHEDRMEVHAAAAIVPANLERNTFLPLHPGPSVATIKSAGPGKPTSMVADHPAATGLSLPGVCDLGRTS